MRRVALVLIPLLSGFIYLGCGQPDPAADGTASDLNARRRHDAGHPDAGHDAGHDAGIDAGPGDAGSDGGTVSDGGTLPICPNRPAGRTQIDAIVRVDRYGGLQNGRNGTHEIIDGVIVQTVAVATPSDVDTQVVHLALNVASSIDPSGLPQEIPLNVGDTLEVVGEYIPASQANASTLDGPAAVIHFTHTPCGSVTINGNTYQ